MQHWRPLDVLRHQRSEPTPCLTLCKRHPFEPKKVVESLGFPGLAESLRLVEGVLLLHVLLVSIQLGLAAFFLNPSVKGVAMDAKLSINRQ